MLGSFSLSIRFMHVLRVFFDNDFFPIKNFVHKAIQITFRIQLNKGNFHFFLFLFLLWFDYFL